MRIFVDTNVFVAAITDEEGKSDVATQLLNSDHEFITSLLYPLDTLILAAANAQDATVTSFDSELLDNGAVHPEELL